MVNRSGGRRSRCRSGWIGRLMCGVAAVIAALAAVAAVASAQVGPHEPALPNPGLTAKCGNLRIILVLDESSSISAADVVRTQDAARAFVRGLNGTGTELAIDAFAANARRLSGYREVNDANTPSLNAAINTLAGSGVSRAGTNWDAAFRQVQSLNASTAPADLVVFMTDGNPNTYVGGPAATESQAGWERSIGPAVTSANNVKRQGSRIFAIGVGAALSSADSVGRLTAISGDRQFPSPDGNFFTADYTLNHDFTQFEQALSTIVSRLCGSSLEITKQVPDHTGDMVAVSGWRFTATLVSQTHTWLIPEGFGSQASAHNTTGDNGVAAFHWTLDTPGTAHLRGAHETPQNGYHFVSAQCFIHHRDGTETELPVNTEEIPAMSIATEEFATCDVLNRPSMANLTVVKSLEPEGDPGLFNLHIGGVADALNVGDVQGTGPHSVPLGTYAVSETAGTGTSLSDYDTSIRCVDLANNYHEIVPTHMGTSVSVPLTSDGQNVVCTIRNVSTKFGQITVIKQLIPEHDPGRFNLLVGGTVEAPAVGDGGHTPPVRLPFGAHEVTETGANGTNLARYNISTTCIDEHTGDTVAHNAHGPSVSVDLSRASDSIECTIENERPGVKVARLEVIKHLVPNDDAGRFDLLTGGKAFALGVGHNGSTGPLEFELGTHSVTEDAAGRTDLADFSISTTCVDKAHGGHTVAHNAHGPSVSVDLTSESDDIVCTITNRRTAPPGGGESATTGPDLGVIKTMPAHARVGESLPITITVHNQGHGVAHGVQLHETPPTGMRIVQVADHGTIQHGTAVWHLGDLAPGESRTVHATARGLHVGLHVDTAVATALNADPALSDAAVRARAAARRRRPPTPPPPLVTG